MNLAKPDSRPDSRPDSQYDASTLGVLRLLRLLARTGAYAEVHATGTVVRQPRDGQETETAIGVDTWQLAVHGGWAGADPTGIRWHLTRRGRQHLKRHLSAAAPIAQKKAEPLRREEKPGFDADESPLAWLSRRRDKDGQPLISQPQLDAGERLRADFWFAQMTPRVTANWSGNGGASGRRSAPGTGVEMQDNVVAAGERVRRALGAVGPELAGILIDVCCHLKGLEEAERNASWPQRTARVVLLLALTRLARHYGLERSGGTAHREPPARVRHWGAAGYRPSIEGGD